MVAQMAKSNRSNDELKGQLSQIQQSTDVNWLMEQLRGSIESSVRHVIIMAAIVRQLEELGHPVEIQIAALPYLRKIAYGNMSAELYVALEGDNLLLSKASALPSPDQEAIARNAPIKVMDAGGDHRMVPPLDLTRDEIFQVFDNGKIRSDAEQIGWLKSRKEKEARKSIGEGEITVTLDKRRGGIVVAGKFLSATELAHYLGELSKR